jgi:peptidoglycan hydrolase-like protein with peptidoglycan-binding domain
MKKERLIGAVVLGGGLGLIANPVWSHDAQRYSGTASRGHDTIVPKESRQEGVSSRDIMEAEKELAQQGFYPGEIDGMMDSQTQHAIAEFQQQNNIPVTGMLDEETSEQLGIAANSQSPEEQVGPQARLSEEEQSLAEGEALEPHFGMYR